MGRKITTYLRPSITDQITAGKGTEEEIRGLYNKLELEGKASDKTLKRLRKVIAKRFP